MPITKDQIKSIQDHAESFAKGLNIEVSSKVVKIRKDFSNPACKSSYMVWYIRQNYKVTSSEWRKPKYGKQTILLYISNK